MKKAATSRKASTMTRHLGKLKRIARRGTRRELLHELALAEPAPKAEHVTD